MLGIFMKLILCVPSTSIISNDAFGFVMQGVQKFPLANANIRSSFSSSAQLAKY